MFKSYCRSLTVLLAFCAGPLWAQSEDEKDKDPDQEQVDERAYVVTVEESLPQVAGESTLITKSPLTFLETPASVTVIPQSLFKSQDAVILSDALTNAAGVNVQTGFGVHDLFVVRGFDSLSSGLILTDGASEPEATFYNLYNVDQVEVLRGPLAFLYGANAVFGAVNLTRKQPRIGQRFVQASTTFGSFDTVRGQFDMNLGSPDSPFAFRLNAMGQRSDGYRSNQNHQVAINPALRWKVSDRTTVTANFEYVTNEYTPDAGIPVLQDRVAPVPRRVSYGSPLDDSDQEIFRFRLDLESRLSDSVTFRTKVYYTDLEWLSDGVLLNGVLPNFETGALEVQRVLNSLDDRQKLFGAQFETLFRFNTGFVAHDLMVGLEATRLTDAFGLDVFFIPPADLFNPNSSAVPPLFPIPGQDQRGDATSVIWSPYVVDRIQPLESLQFFAGGRLDVLDYEESVSSTRRDETQFNPMGAVVFQPMESASVYLSAGTAFGPPSTLVVGERKPEESRQVEGGFKKEFLGGNLQSSLSLYSLRKTNVAIPDQTGFTRQLGRQRSRGVEGAVSAQLTDSWSLFSNYSFNRSKLTRFAETAIVGINPITFAVLDRSGNSAPFAPRHIFNLWTSKEFQNGLGFGIGPRYVSGQFIGADNQFEIDDYWTVDAVASYGLRNWLVSLNFKNMTGAEYEVRGFGASSVIPADGFGVFATIQFTH